MFEKKLPIKLLFCVVDKQNLSIFLNRFSRILKLKNKKLKLKKRTYKIGEIAIVESVPILIFQLFSWNCQNPVPLLFRAHRPSKLIKKVLKIKSYEKSSGISSPDRKLVLLNVFCVSSPEIVLSFSGWNFAIFVLESVDWATGIDSTGVAVSVSIKFSWKK